MTLTLQDFQVHFYPLKDANFTGFIVTGKLRQETQPSTTEIHSAGSI